MRKLLLGLLAVSCNVYSLPLSEPALSKPRQHLTVMDKIMAMTGVDANSVKHNANLQTIRAMLENQSVGALSPLVINKVMTSLKCMHEYQMPDKPILTVIDYSLPANEKRLWIFDLQQKKLLFHTYVSHGIKSGFLFTNFFSNKNDSKASSIGVYQTDEAYYGREGVSLRLRGLDPGFNDNAGIRYIVMHGGWYVQESFIKKYGRPGRSWGCPAVPLDQSKPIINTIKNNSVLVAYYPDENWFAQSKFLNCQRLGTFHNDKLFSSMIKPLRQEDMQRDDILFVDSNGNGRHEENEAVVTISADNYVKIFNLNPPLSRMLRRQINNEEYIVLSKEELHGLLAKGTTDKENQAFNSLVFVIPEIIMVRGYYETQMKVVNLGKPKEILSNGLAGDTFTMQTSGKTLRIKPNNSFIRWIGL